jgi:hypothetical protein
LSFGSVDAELTTATLTAAGMKPSPPYDHDPPEVE